MQLKQEGMETDHQDLMETGMTSQPSMPTLDAQHDRCSSGAPLEPRQEQ
jgi:hypothetical protein